MFVNKSYICYFVCLISSVRFRVCRYAYRSRDALGYYVGLAMQMQFPLGSQWKLTAIGAAEFPVLGAASDVVVVIDDSGDSVMIRELAGEAAGQTGNITKSIFQEYFERQIVAAEVFDALSNFEERMSLLENTAIESLGQNLAALENIEGRVSLLDSTIAETIDGQKQKYEELFLIIAQNIAAHESLDGRLGLLDTRVSQNIENLNQRYEELSSSIGQNAAGHVKLEARIGLIDTTFADNIERQKQDFGEQLERVFGSAMSLEKVLSDHRKRQSSVADDLQEQVRQACEDIKAEVVERTKASQEILSNVEMLFSAYESNSKQALVLDQDVMMMRLDMATSTKSVDGLKESIIHEVKDRMRAFDSLESAFREVHVEITNSFSSTNSLKEIMQQEIKDRKCGQGSLESSIGEIHDGLQSQVQSADVLKEVVNQETQDRKFVLDSLESAILEIHVALHNEIQNRSSSDQDMLRAVHDVCGSLVSSGDFTTSEAEPHSLPHVEMVRKVSVNSSGSPSPIGSSDLNPVSRDVEQQPSCVSEVFCAIFDQGTLQGGQEVHEVFDQVMINQAAIATMQTQLLPPVVDELPDSPLLTPLVSPHAAATAAAAAAYAAAAPAAAAPAASPGVVEAEPMASCSADGRTNATNSLVSNEAEVISKAGTMDAQQDSELCNWPDDATRAGELAGQICSPDWQPISPRISPISSCFVALPLLAHRAIFDPALASGLVPVSERSETSAVSDDVVRNFGQGSATCGQESVQNRDQQRAMELSDSRLCPTSSTTSADESPVIQVSSQTALSTTKPDPTIAPIIECSSAESGAGSVCSASSSPLSSPYENPVVSPAVASSLPVNSASSQEECSSVTQVLEQLIDQAMSQQRPNPLTVATLQSQLIAHLAAAGGVVPAFDLAIAPGSASSSNSDQAQFPIGSAGTMQPTIVADLAVASSASPAAASACAQSQLSAKIDQRLGNSTDEDIDESVAAPSFASGAPVSRTSPKTSGRGAHASSPRGVENQLVGATSLFVPPVVSPTAGDASDRSRRSSFGESIDQQIQRMKTSLDNQVRHRASSSQLLLSKVESLFSDPGREARS